MRRLALAVFLAVGLLVLAGASAQAATTGIKLGSSFPVTVQLTFTGNGGTGVVMTFDPTTPYGGSVNGPGSGTGALAGIGGSWSMVDRTGGTSGAFVSITLTPQSGGFGTATDWNVVQSAPLYFCFTSSSNCHGTQYLTGDLQLLTFQQSIGSSSGTYNFTSAANLVVTGGTLASYFPSGGITTLTLSFTSTMNINMLIGTTNSTTSGVVWYGEVDPVPEPGTIALLGAGLLAVGTLLRRRRSS